MHESPILENSNSNSEIEVLVMDNLGELRTPEEAEELFIKQDRTRVSRLEDLCSRKSCLGSPLHHATCLHMRCYHVLRNFYIHQPYV